MKQNIMDYVKIFKGALDESTCNNVLIELQNSPGWQRHLFYHSTGVTIDHGTEPLVYRGNVIPTYPYLMEAIWKTIKEYIESLNFSWYTSWQGFDNLKFIQYDVDTEMVNHCDHIHSMFDGPKRGIPILSVIGLLNDNFEGGEFIMFNDAEINLQAGDILIFPSVFLYPHTVKKIISGKRFSLATWVY